MEIELYPSDKETSLEMSNFDYTIDDGFEEALKSGLWGRYAGWNFNGRVRFDKESNYYICEVWRYQELVDIVKSTTLADLIPIISDKWGWK